MSDGDGSHWLARYARTNLRFLTFRNAPIAPEDRGRFIKAALVCTWIAGIGRYWDHPDAHWWQYAGLGSVACVFVIALLFWLVSLPLAPRGWGYRSVLLFVAMTSPLAWLSALPVGAFVRNDQLDEGAVSVAALVVLWRTALWVRHVRSALALRGWKLLTAWTAPFAAVAPILVSSEHAPTILDALDEGPAVEEVVERPTSPQWWLATRTTPAVFVWWTLPLWFPLLGIAYGVAVVEARERRGDLRSSERREHGA